MNATQDEPVTEPEDEIEDTSYRTLNDAEAVQRLVEQTREEQNKERLVADNAIIEEIRCQNFMCHGDLQIKLGPLINFIIGHNGSGKSAVLTALTICLGGKASATNRGASLKSFIKEGREKCTLSVKIKNQGKSSYKPEIYGPTIVVERYFSQNNSSGYTLKSSTGKIISRRREDLDDILDFYMLQLDNPMNVLTQDMARQFLNSSSGGDKYKFFQKGTQLEQLDADYRQTTNFVEEIQVSQLDVAEEVAEKRAAYEAAQKNSQSISAQQKTLRQIKQVEAQICWAQVEEEERKLEKLHESLRQIDVDIERHQASFEDASEKYSGARQTVERLEAKKSEISAELLPLNDQIADLKEKFDANRGEMVDLQVEERHIHSEISVTKEQVKRFKKDIDEENQRLQTQSGGRSVEIATEIEALDSKTQEAKHNQHQQREEKKRVLREAESLKESKQSCRDAVELQDQRIRTRQHRIEELEQGSGGNNMSLELRQVLADINKESRFREKPVGPMWKHVSLTEQRWSSILETSFGGVLDGFCVTSKHDQDLLTQILKKRRL
jgi:chromosome segregation ATPase